MNAKVNTIDLALSVLCATARRDESLTTYEIADICECSQTLISKTLRSALKKLRDNNALSDFI